MKYKQIAFLVEFRQEESRLIISLQIIMHFYFVKCIDASVFSIKVLSKSTPYIYGYIHTLCINASIFVCVYRFKWKLIRELNTNTTDIKMSSKILDGYKAGIKMRLEQALNSAHLYFVILAWITILALFRVFLFLHLLLYPLPKSYLKLFNVKWATYKVKIVSCECNFMVYFEFTDDVTNCLQLD